MLRTKATPRLLKGRVSETPCATRGRETVHGRAVLETASLRAGPARDFLEISLKFRGYILFRKKIPISNIRKKRRGLIHVLSLSRLHLLCSNVVFSFE